MLRTLTLLLSLMAVALALASGCSTRDTTAEQTQRTQIPSQYKLRANPFGPLDRKALAEGQQLYELRCLVCHGEDGKGKGFGAPDLNVPPADLTNVEKYGNLTDGEWFYLISQGNPLRQMPAWRRFLGEDDIWRLVLYVRQFSRKT